MDIKSLKEKAINKTKEAVNFWAKKISQSKYTINKKEDLDKIIKKSKTTTFKNKETWEEKQYKHKSIVIFAEENSDFFKDAIYMLPILVTKAFTQNIWFRLSKSKIEWVDLKDYKIEKKNLPSLVVFENKEVFKIINGKENILKLVKSIDLDINKLIEKA